jgi:hypothetical protein
MPTCYAITRGDYSDYRVCAVFTTHELAESECFMYGSDAEVEAFPLDPILPKPPAGMYGFRCSEERVYYSTGYGPAVLEAYQENGCDIQTRNVGVVRGNSHGLLSVILWARDKSHAIKIASEKFAQYRAIQAGVA